MNKLLLEKVLKAFNIGKNNEIYPTRLTTIELGLTLKAYSWNDVEFYYIDYVNELKKKLYFVVVLEGKIPYDVRTSLNERKEKEKLNFLNGLLDHDNAYYIIKNVDEFVIILSEIYKYYHKGKPVDEQKIISEVYKDTIIETKPTKKTEEYLAEDKSVYEIHQMAIDNNPTTFGKSFLEALSDFDNAVNPFMNYQESGKSFEEYIKSLNFERLRVIIDTPKSHVLGKGELLAKLNYNIFLLDDFELTIEDKETGNTAYTSRDNGRFTYAIEYNLPEGKKMKVMHSLNSKEIITVITEDSSNPDTLKITYNMTNNAIAVCSPSHAPAQIVNKKYLKYKSQLYTYLLTGINMAKMITINNMTQIKPGKTRERIKPTTEE